MLCGSCTDDQTVVFDADASACKGMLVRAGPKEGKYLSTKQLWVPGATQGPDIDAQNPPRAESVSDISTHQVGGGELIEGLRRTE